tara:strand:+ start:18923 stop:19384 length:462 start_codon:yes stop_codon:yes gene_type:complete
MTSIDPQTPPDIQEQMDMKKRLLELEDPSEDFLDVSEQQETPPESFEDIKKIITEAPKRSRKREFKAVLKHDLYTVSFPVEDISIASYQLALKIPRNDFKFEPVPQSKFILEVRSKTYPIIYVGGLFDFPSDETWALTFILDYDDTPPSNELE